jgi:hypothetical protein
MKTMTTFEKAGSSAILLVLLLALPASPARADSRVRAQVGVGWGAYFGAPAYFGYGGYYYPSFYPPGIFVPPPTRPYYAFVDTDIHPEEANVYLDGKLIGIADDFDGYPGYLALKPGRHTLVFLAQGRHSLTFDLNLRSGQMIDLDRKLPRLNPGEKEEAPPAPPPAKTAADSGETSPAAAAGEKTDQGHFGTLRLEVAPSEARVMLDGDFFGTGGEISRLHAGIPLAPGVHRIRVSLTGYKSAALETEIKESEENTLRISLKKQ